MSGATAVAAAATTAAAAAAKGASNTPQILPYIADFYEQQESGTSGCGRHAVNNLFHAPYFSKTDATKPITDKTIGTIKPPGIPLNDLCVFLQSKYDYLEACPANEDYDINILLAALDVIGHPANINMWARDENDATHFTPQMSPDQLLGYIINYGGGHWVALRKIPVAAAGPQFEYIDSIRGEDGLPVRRPYGTVQECLEDVQRNGASISNIIEVGEHRGGLNPLQRFQDFYKNRYATQRAADLLASEKAATINAFVKYQQQLQVPLGVEATSGKQSFPETTTVYNYILNGILKHPRNVDEIKAIGDVLRAPGRDAAVAEQITNNVGLIASIADTAQFLGFLRGGAAAATAASAAASSSAATASATGPATSTTATTTVPPVATAATVATTTSVSKQEPESSTVLVNLVGNTFVLDFTQASNQRRKDYSEANAPGSPAKGSLDAEETRLLRFLGVQDPTNSIIRPLLDQFFKALATCNTDAKVVVNHGCDMPLHLLWKIRELRHEAAKTSSFPRLIGGMQLAALRAMVDQAPRLLAFARAHALENRSGVIGKAGAKGKTGTSGMPANAVDADLDALFTI
jgi:hypothetical protein